MAKKSAKGGQKKGQGQPAQTSKENIDSPKVSNGTMSIVATTATGTTSTKSSDPPATSSNPPATSSNPPIYTTTTSKTPAMDAEDGDNGDKRNDPHVQTNKSSDPPATSSNPPTTLSDPPIYAATATKPSAMVAEGGDTNNVPLVQIPTNVVPVATASKQPATLAEEAPAMLVHPVQDPVLVNAETASESPVKAVTDNTPKPSDRGTTTTATTPILLVGANDVSVVTQRFVNLSVNCAFFCTPFFNAFFANTLICVILVYMFKDCHE
jgi:hypothetical protein